MKTLTVVIALSLGGSVVAQRPIPSHQTAAPARPVPHEVARVNATSLTSDRLDAATSALLPMESFHRNITADKIAALRRKALEQLIDDELEYQDGLRRDVTVQEAAIAAGLRDAARPYGGLRGFSEALRQTGASMAAARREVTRTLVIKKTVATVVTAKCQVGPAEAAAFFRANPDRFVEPEQLHIFAITIGVDPSSGAEQWAAAKTRAEDVRRQLDAGASFEDMARTFSTDPSKNAGGDMGFVHRGSLSDRFEQIARDLAPGHISDVVETLYGYHIVRVSEVRAAERKTFAEIGASLQKELTATRCAGAKNAWVARLRQSATIVRAE